MRKHFAFGEVKAVEGLNPNGEFEVILSVPTLDRDEEIIDAKAFDPLPDSIPFHAFHDFSDPIGRAVPTYEGDVLKARGYYASTPRAQEIRALVADGVIGHTSVGFMPPKREVRDGVTHIVKGELLEGSFVSVPSNREAAVLAAKGMASAAEARGKPHPERKSISGSWEERRDLLRDAIRSANPDAWWTGIVATFDDAVVYEIDTFDGTTQYQASYSITAGVVTLGAAEEVTVTELVAPKGVTTSTAANVNITVTANGMADVKTLAGQVLSELANRNSAATDPEKAAAPAAASPADVPVGMARAAALRAEAELLLLD
jgi:HK97 family phage prohead protease